MDLRTRLESHTVKSLKAEIKKVKTSFNYGKLKKDELIDLMLKNKDKFNHIQHADTKKPAPKKEEPKKVKKIIKKSEPKEEHKATAGDDIGKVKATVESSKIKDLIKNLGKN